MYLTERYPLWVFSSFDRMASSVTEKGIYLEDGTLVGHLLPVIDGGLGQSEKLQRRLSL